VGIVTGHKAEGETDGRYHAGPTDKLLAECVRAVQFAESYKVVIPNRGNCARNMR
jgi:hypothetical protein